MSEAPNPSPESQPLWYYADAANQPVGPLPMDALQHLAKAGIISPETNVIEKGGTEWKAWHSILTTATIRQASTSAEPAHIPAKDTPPPETPSNQSQKISGKDAASGVGCLILIGLAVVFILGKCSGCKESNGDAGGSAEQTSQSAKTFDFTPDSFREAFNRQARVMDLDDKLEIQQWKFGRGEVQDTVETKFNSSGLIAAIDKKTGKLKDISVLAAHGNGKEVSELMFLAVAVVATADPSIPADKRGKTVIQVLADRTKKESLGHLEIGALDIDAALMFYAHPKP